MFKSVLTLALIAGLIRPPMALAAGPTAQQLNDLERIVEKEADSLKDLSSRRIVTEFENLAALIYGEKTKGLLKVDAKSSKEQKDRVAHIAVRYAALKKKVESIKGAKEAVYVKLFGDREHSPYYGAVNQDEFRDEGYLFCYALTGSPIFLVLYILANMDER